MSKFLLYLFIIAYACNLSSCTHYYYGPNSLNVPLFKEQDEARVSAAISGANETTGFELQSAYAFGKNFGAMLNFYAAGGKDRTSISGPSGGSNFIFEKGNGTITEIGVGYFQPLNARKWIIEVYGGLGGGSVNNYYKDNEFSKVGLTKLFIQPSFGYSNEEGTLETAIGMRFSSVKFNVKEANFITANNSFDNQQVRDIRNNDHIVFAEPSFLFRGGAKNVKIQVQLTASNALRQKAFFTQELNSSLGVIFCFSGKVKK